MAVTLVIIVILDFLFSKYYLRIITKYRPLSLAKLPSLKIVDDVFRYAYIIMKYSTQLNAALCICLGERKIKPVFDFFFQKYSQKN